MAQPDLVQPDVTQLDLTGIAALLDLLNFLPDDVVFIKDRQARYVYANNTLLRRLRMPSLSELVGRTSSAVFPGSLGETYTQQDLKVLAGQTMTEHLEWHLYPSGEIGWCLTTKRVIKQPGTLELAGLVGLSRDLKLPPGNLGELGELVTFIQEHYAEQITIQALAQRGGLSVSTFERQVKRVYGVTPSQLLVRARIQAATKLLQGVYLRNARYSSMTEPVWAEAIRARTERLIQELAEQLPENAGPVSIEEALTQAENAYFGDLAQEVMNSIHDEKKV